MRGFLDCCVLSAVRILIETIYCVFCISVNFFKEKTLRWHTLCLLQAKRWKILPSLTCGIFWSGHLWKCHQGIPGGIHRVDISTSFLGCEEGYRDDKQISHPWLNWEMERETSEKIEKMQGLDSTVEGKNNWLPNWDAGNVLGSSTKTAPAGSKSGVVLGANRFSRKRYPWIRANDINNATYCKDRSCVRL